MNLIDALKVNGKATLPEWKNHSYVREYKDLLSWECCNTAVSYENLMRQDWNPYDNVCPVCDNSKEKKEVVIEGVTWERDKGEPMTSYSDNWPDDLLNELPNKPPMKMVLTWEE